MAVETRYAVVKKGVEVLLTTDKKHADEYDKMLDVADALSQLIEQSGCQLDERLTEELSIYLAKNKAQVLTALTAKKLKVVKSKPLNQKPQDKKPQDKKTQDTKPQDKKRSEKEKLTQAVV